MFFFRNRRKKTEQTAKAAAETQRQTYWISAALDTRQEHLDRREHDEHLGWRPTPTPSDPLAPPQPHTKVQSVSRAAVQTEYLYENRNFSDDGEKEKEQSGGVEPQHWCSVSIRKSQQKEEKMAAAAAVLVAKGKRSLMSNNLFSKYWRVSLKSASSLLTEGEGQGQGGGAAGHSKVFIRQAARQRGRDSSSHRRNLAGEIQPQ